MRPDDASPNPLPIDHPSIPEPIRVAAKPYWTEGDSLIEVPTDQGIEWWLLDREGELIEAFWLER